MDGYLNGDEEVVLTNLTPEGSLRFHLPRMRPKAIAVKSVELKGSLASTPPPTIKDEVDLRADTLCLLPEEGRFYIVWRGLCPVEDLTASEVVSLEIKQDE